VGSTNSGFKKGGLKGALVVFDIGSFAQRRKKLDGLDKRLWRLEAMVMASTLCVVVAAVSLFVK
jgi:hypothetical protein